ncbi:MAG: molybdopterin-guanine dinucleotide biosynthesis protein B [Bauldia sp.]|nr:molybdopterin-guanine dinucleotide biosynthesis protein B [Bauldia sp.]
MKALKPSLRVKHEDAEPGRDLEHSSAFRAQPAGNPIALPQVLGVAGWKNSGKTTLISRLIPALRARGISVSTVKHVHHAIDLDQPGKDTFVHREAGAVDVVMFSRSRWAILHERREDATEPPDLADILRRLSPVDLVLVEGFKSIPMKRIEIRSGEDPPPLHANGDADTVALVSDGAPLPGTPSFRRDEVGALADFIGGLVRAGALEMGAWPDPRNRD